MLVLSHMYEARINAEYIDKAAAVSKLIAAMVDGERVDRYLETLETDEEYERLLNIMWTLQEDAGVAYIYISRITPHGEIFVFDSDGYDLGKIQSLENSFGDLSHDANIKIINHLMSGERVAPYITNTPEWGWLLTVYEPVYRADGSVAAYAGVDISMDEIMQERKNVLTMVGLLILLVFSASIAANLYVVQRYLIAPVHMLINHMMNYTPENEKPLLKLKQGDELALLEYAMMDMEDRITNVMEDLKDAEEVTQIMVDTYPLCCHIMNSHGRIIDCNEAALKLFGFDNKQDYMRQFFKFTPKYQPDGRYSREKARVLLRKALEEESFGFEWMHTTPDGAPLPTEVKLVRVAHKTDYLLVCHVKDMRMFEQMENKIHELEAEADKIYYDALTGIYNRRYFDEHLEQIVKSLSRLESSSLSIMMIDIDKFKDYNDTYGHNEGDNCLKAVAEAIARSVTRDDDFAARYGGEEFVVVLPGTGEEGARKIAGKLLENVIQCNIPHEKNPAAAYVTVSVGVASGKADYTKPAEYYIKAADELLYYSKENGRNRYTFGTF